MQCRRHGAVTLAVAVATALALAATAQAGSYIVAQCSAGFYAEAPDAGYATTSSHFTATSDCSQNANGMQVGYHLGGGDTGTEAGRYGMWVWQAPAGTYITGGSAYSRLATEDGIHGYLAVSPDAGPGIATENQNDDQLHLSAIPTGNWRYFVARLECTQPNEGSRCVGPAAGAHAFVKQLRLQLTDVVPPTLALGGTLLAGGTLRGSQTLAVSAADQGAGLEAVQIAVNGKPAGGDNLLGACNPLPFGFTARTVPCPGALAKTYVLNTEAAPFVEGANTVAVCAYDYSQSGPPNAACSPLTTVAVDNSCTNSPVGGGAALLASFRSGRESVTRRRRHGSRVVGKLTDANGDPVGNATICVKTHTLGIGGPTGITSVQTNPAGHYSYRVPAGPNRQITIGYRHDSFQLERVLRCYARAIPRLRAHPRHLRNGHWVHFTGRLPGPHRRRRVVIMQAAVVGSKRWITFRRATTDGRGYFNASYHFDATTRTTAYRFRALVPRQAGYPWLQGHSTPVRVLVRG